MIHESHMHWEPGGFAISMNEEAGFYMCSPRGYLWAISENHRALSCTIRESLLQERPCCWKQQRFWLIVCRTCWLHYVSTHLWIFDKHNVSGEVIPLAETLSEDWDQNANSRQSVSELMESDTRCGWILSRNGYTVFCLELKQKQDAAGAFRERIQYKIVISLKWLSERLTTQAGSPLTISFCECNLLNIFSIILSMCYAFVCRNKVLSLCET